MIYLWIISIAAAFFMLLLLVAAKREAKKPAAPANYEELKERVREIMTGIYVTGSEPGGGYSYIRRSMRKCASADPAACRHVHDYIAGLMGELGVTEANVDGFLPGQWELSAADCFEMLWAAYSLSDTAGIFDRLCARFGWFATGHTLTAGEVFEAVRESGFAPDGEVRLEFLTQRIYEELFGLGPVDLLVRDSSLDGVSAGIGGLGGAAYDYVEELLRGGTVLKATDKIYCMYRGRTVRPEFLSFESETALAVTAGRLAGNDASAQISRRNPYVVGTLADNSRVTVMRPPACASWCFFVRRFSSAPVLSVSELVTDEGSELVERLLSVIVKGQQNIVLSGNQGGGKTTLLKAIVGYIDPVYTLRVAESSFELNLSGVYPERNVVSLQERGRFTVFDALTAYKKTDSDIVILGEVNEPKLAGALVQLVQNGGRMVMTTLHHNTTGKLMDYLRNALMSEYGICDAAVAEAQAVDAVNFDVHLIRDTGGHHYIERITEIVPRRNGEHAYTLSNVLVFDREKECYRIENGLSPEAAERLRAVLKRDELEAAGEFLNGEITV